eukprot:scaffold6203_cov125-Cylindrotheca_fusiformis.AAC.3
MTKNEKGSKEEGLSLKAKKLSLSAHGHRGQADLYSETTKAIANYVGRLYGKHLRVLVLTGKEAVLEEPKYPDNENKKTKELAIWSKEYDEYMKDRKTYSINKAKTFVTILNHCDAGEAMLKKVESASNYGTLEEQTDIVGLLKVIKDLAFLANNLEYPYLHQAATGMRRLYKTHQASDESLHAYYKRFVGLVEMAERQHGRLVPTAIVKKNDEDAGRQRLLAVLFMDGAYKGMSGGYMKDLANTYYALDDAPNTLTVLRRHIRFWISTVRKMQVERILAKKKKSKFRDDEEESHAQFKVNGQCRECGKNKGHKATECPNANGDNSSIQTDSTASQSHHSQYRGQKNKCWEINKISAIIWQSCMERLAKIEG